MKRQLIKPHANMYGMSTSALRQHAREVFGPGSWTAFASRNELYAIFEQARQFGVLTLPPHLAEKGGSAGQSATQSVGESTMGTLQEQSEALAKELDQLALSGAAASQGLYVSEKAAATTKVPTAEPVANAAKAGLLAIQAALESAVTRDEVASIVEHALSTVDVSAQVKRAVERALESMPPVSIKVGAREPVKLEGRKHVQFKRMLDYGARFETLWVSGPAGSGKTTAAQEAAALLGYKTFLVTPAMTRYDVLGFQNANGDHVATEVTRFAQHEGEACLILDEVDGWADGAQLAANTLLANSFVVLSHGLVDVTHGGKYRKWVVATGNTWGTGPNADYVGRKKLDAAFLNRFAAKLHWGYDLTFERGLACAWVPEGAEECMGERALDLVLKVQKAREYLDSKGIKVIVSPRQTMAAVRGLVAGDSERVIFDEIVMGGATEQQRSDVCSHCGVRS